MSKYTMIHCHSDNSLKDSPLKVKDLVKKAKEAGAGSVALTDHGVCTGNIEFLNECKKAEINGIPGVEAYIKTDYAEHAHLILLAKSYEGYQDICRVITKGNENITSIGGIEYPVLTYDDLKLVATGRVICTSACILGVIGAVLSSNDIKKKQIDKLKNQRSKYSNPEDKAFLANTEASRKAENEIKSLTDEKTRLEALAKKNYTKRVNALKTMTGDMYEYKKNELMDEMAETEKAKGLLEEIKKKITAAKSKKAVITRRLNESSKTHGKYIELTEKINVLESGLHSEDEILTLAEKELLRFKGIFGDDFYAEVQNHGMEDEKAIYPVIAKLAVKNDVKVVCSNDSHMANRDEAEARQFMKALRFSRWEPISASDYELYMKNEKELYESLIEIIDVDIARSAIINTRKIGDMCHVEIPDTPHYPLYKEGTQSMDTKALLRKKAEEGIKRRYKDGEFTEEYRKRMEYELSVICELGFADYLLIVADYVNYGRQYSINHYPNLSIGYGIGPGRGSGAGCLVNYLIGITNIDPLKYGLIFERFLNKDRVSMPDIDVDFSAEVRDPSIEYVKQKYGEESVACIRTCLTQGAKAAIRNSARIRGFELYGEDADKDYKDKMDELRNLGDRISKNIPNNPEYTLSEHAEELLKEYQGNKDAEVIIKRAVMVENTITGFGVHAAGIIIGDGQPLKNFVPLMYNTNKEQWTVQCDMIEAEGSLKMLKMDFLGLNNLDVITECLRRILVGRGQKIDIDHIPFEKEIFEEVFSEGRTSSVFQFESDGMKDMLKQFKPESFEDVILMVAAYRPGPMDFIPEIIKVKFGEKKPEYIVKELEEILSPTYGYPIYQEQLMDIFHKCAGFSLGEADIIRRYMSKKKVDAFLSYKEQFVNGIVEKGATKESAEALWTSLEGFAKYAFNKSHAAAYGFIAYQTAWLKYHYPNEYMCSVLNHASVDKIPKLLGECRAMGITVSVPDVNRSKCDFNVVGNEIVYGLGRIKGFSKDNVDKILETRKGQKFNSVTDFLIRTPVKEKAVESLIKAGALDEFINGRRRGYLTVLQQLCKLTEDIRKKNEILAAEDSTDRKKQNAHDAIKRDYQDINDLAIPEIENDLLEDEKELLGTYLSRHPLDFYDHIFKSRNIIPISDVTNGIGEYAGMISDIKQSKRKSDGAEMAFFTLEDKTGSIKVCAFTKAYSEYKNLIYDGNVVIIKGKGNVTDDSEDGFITSELHAYEITKCQKKELTMFVSFEDENAKKHFEIVRKAFIDEEKGHPVVTYDAFGEQKMVKCEYRLKGDIMKIAEKIPAITVKILKY